MKRSRNAVLLAAMIALPAYAHGEQVLVFPASFLFLIVPAMFVLLVPWERWWVRIITTLVIPVTNVALWPVVADIATYHMGRAMATLLVLPLVAAALLGTALWLRRRGVRA